MREYILELKRIDNGHYQCVKTGTEFMSTWRYEKKFDRKLNDRKLSKLALDEGIVKEKNCPIEFEKARRIYGDFVYMYPVDWLHEKSVEI